ncbi:MAG: TlpA disulfide reductase family protein [Gemmataceae bacterium]
MRTATWMLTLALATISQAQVPDEVRWKTVRYEGLAQEIADLRGKVVVIDFWNHTCKHCLDNFPRLTQLQAKYAGQGMVVVTVSVDEKESHERAAAVLRKKGMASTRNLLLDEELEVWQKKLPIESLPSVYVFDRRGKWTRFEGKGDRELSYDEVEAAVQPLLQEK